MPKPWLYDETIQVGTDYKDEREVNAYDEIMGKLRNIEAEIDDIITALSLSTDSTLWEIGTGTGECSLALAPICGKIYATDTSPAMLSYARKKAVKRQINNVSFEIGGFLSGFKPEGIVDAIVSQLALHHLPDFWKTRALEIIAGKLRPGGRFYLRDLVFSSEIEDYEAFFDEAIERVREIAGVEVSQQTVQHIKTEYSTLDWIIEGMLERSGLKICDKYNQDVLTVYVCEK